MPRVLVQTDNGVTVKEFEIDAHAGRMLPDGVPMNATAHRVLIGVKRAIRDADMIGRGEDPERTSEKVMRMLDEQRRAKEAETGECQDPACPVEGRHTVHGGRVS